MDEQQERFLIPVGFEAREEVVEEPTEMVLTQIKLGSREKVVIVAVLAILAAVFLYAVRHVLPPFVWGVVVAYILNPVVNWLSTKTRLSRSVIVPLMALVLFVGMGWVLYNVTTNVADDIYDLSRDWPTMLESAEKRVFGGTLPSFFGYTVSARTISEAVGRSVGDFPRSAVTAITRTVDTLGKLLIFFVTTFLLLLDAKKISAWLPKVIPRAYRDEVLGLGREINRTLGAYIRGQLFLFVLMSTLTWIALGPILQLRYAVVISLVTGILEWFPIIGPITAGAIAVTIGLFQPNTLGWDPWIYGLVIAIIYTLLRHMEDYLVIPNVIGRAVHIHPLIVLFALFSGGALAGVLGMFIAVPVAAVVKILAEYIYHKLTM